MKRITIICLTCLLLNQLIAFSENVTDPLSVTKHQLDNGLEVYLNYDPYQTDIFFNICVKAGSAQDPVNATGIAHYFEHMMFKGTDSIGAIDFKNEKILLDSLSHLYQLYSNTNDKDLELKYRKQISELSNAAMKYANPFEFNILLESLGCYNINAFTSYDYTNYQCRMPQTSMPRALEVYAEQFRNPVFRDFQSEMETVYDERNSYIELPFWAFINEYRESVYKGTSYQNPIIGKANHLKKPTIKGLKSFFETYYVANNMAIIVSGDFNEADLLYELDRTFGFLKRDSVLKDTTIEVSNEKMGYLKATSVTPVTAFIASYKTFSIDHNKKHIADICEYLLLNEYQTGTLDRLASSSLFNSISKIKIAGLKEPLVTFSSTVGYTSTRRSTLRGYFDESVSMVVNGEFMDEDLAFAKQNYIKDWELGLEDPQFRMEEFMKMFVLGIDWILLRERIQKVESITREDVVAVAKELFNQMYSYSWSAIKAETVKKQSAPEWIKNANKNFEVQSDFGARILKKTVSLPKPGILEFGSDIIIDSLDNGNSVFYSKNPYNDIYTLKIMYNYGSYNDKLLEASARYVSVSGSEIRPVSTMMQSFRKAEATHYFNCDPNTFTVSLTGREAYLKDAIKLLGEKMRIPRGTDYQLKLVRNSYRYERQVNNDNQYYLSVYMVEHLRTQKKSYFKQNLPLNVLMMKDSSDYLMSFRKVLDYNAGISFTGSIDIDTLKSYLEMYIPMPDTTTKGDYYSPENTQYDTNKVYYYKKKYSTQNGVFILKEGGVVDDLRERVVAKCFMTYFADGPSSIMQKYLRLEKPLVYSQFSNLILPVKNGGKLAIYTMAGTQSSKSMVVLNALNALYYKFPEDSSLFARVKINTANSLKDDIGSFRERAQMVAFWHRLGHKSDPRKAYLDYIDGVTLNDLKVFYEKHINNGSKIFGIIGNTYFSPKKEMKTIGEPERIKDNDFLIL